MEGIDFETIPKDAWSILVRHYDIMEDQSPIERKVYDFFD